MNRSAMTHSLLAGNRAADRQVHDKDRYRSREFIEFPKVQHAAYPAVTPSVATSPPLPDDEFVAEIKGQSPSRRL